MKFWNFLGFFILAVAHLIFLGAIAFEQKNHLCLLFLGVILLALLFSGYFHLFLKSSQNILQIKDFSLIVFGTTFGTLLTFFLNVNLGFGPVIATGFTGVFSSLFPIFLKKDFLKNFAPTMYCGAFVGMTSGILRGNIWILVFAGILSEILFFLVQNIWKGIGGKLGTIAFISVVFVLFMQNFPSFPHLQNFLTLKNYFGNFLVIIIFGVGALGAVIPYLLQDKLKWDPILSSAFPSLILGMVFSLFLKTFDIAIISSIPICFIGASFVGMTNKSFFTSWIWIAIAGIFFGGIFLFSSQFFAGFGGGLGTIAAISTIIVYAIFSLFKKSLIK